MKYLIFHVLLLASLVALMPASYAADEHGHDHEEAHAEEEGSLDLSAEQIKAAGIETAVVQSGALAKEVSVPGKIVAAADRMAQIVPKVSGTVTEARKNLGDKVEKGEVMALIESREMAEAVADHLAAKRAEELARTTFNREKDLWDKKITAEQDYLNAKNAHQESVIRLDLTRQKLQALGHEGSMNSTRFHEIKSPLSGRVIGRELTLGEYVDSTHAAYTVADLSVVWVETAIAPADVEVVREGQAARLSSGSVTGEGRLIFVSPAIEPETRTAKAIIEVANPEGIWRPGAFVTAAIATAKQGSGLIVPREALQSIEGKPVVFVRTEHGFEKREITTGKDDSRQVEVLTGLKSGETIAVANTFTLKAELGKSEAEHEH